MTLTTFVAVPWNAPYYERLGFSVLAPGDVGEELRRIRDHEAALGLEPVAAGGDDAAAVRPTANNLALRWPIRLE